MRKILSTILNAVKTKGKLFTTSPPEEHYHIPENQVEDFTTFTATCAILQIFTTPLTPDSLQRKIFDTT
jgi:hypothetical protein